MITPERLSAWRIFPRLLITLYGVAFFRTTEWFMQLPDPTNAQSAFVSVVVGAGAAWLDCMWAEPDWELLKLKIKSSYNG